MSEEHSFEFIGQYAKEIKATEVELADGYIAL